MLLIYGLGNNDSKYLHTKHNAGRLVLEKLGSGLGLNFQKKDNFAFAVTRVGDEDVYLLYSLGYMNNSGDPLASFCRYFKLDFSLNKSNLLILHDDSDQLESKVKLLPGGGSAGHHGINSIYKYILNLRLSSENIWRLKIGIRPPENKLKSETFVLKNISPQEIEYFQDLANQLEKHLFFLIKSDFSKVQTSLNQSLTLDNL